MKTKLKAKEIANYVMECCGVNNTQGIPFKDMCKEICFLIDNS